jgi:hypothetical protein
VVRKARRARIVPTLVLTAGFASVVPACAVVACSSTPEPIDCNKAPYCHDVAFADFANVKDVHDVMAELGTFDAQDVTVDSSDEATLDSSDETNDGGEGG